MKKYLFFILCICWYIDALAYVYSSNETVDSFDETEVIINSGVVITANGSGFISVNTPVFLYNNGTINGTIDINDNNVIVYNSGTMNGQIVNNGGSFGNITQKITPDTGIHFVDVSGVNFHVQIENIGENSLNFSDIKDIGATSFKLTDSYITIDDFSAWQSWGKTITASGNIHLVITDENIMNYNGEIIDNINASGDMSLNIEIPGLDASQRADAEYVGGHFRLKISPETNNEIGSGGADSALEEIRKRNKHDKLLKKLDKANGDTERARIKNKSYRFNHGILLRPIRVINDFALMDNMADKNDFGLGFKPVYIISDKINNFGGRVYIGNHYNDLYFNVGLSFNRFEYSDDINDFSGFLYGADFRIKQYFNKLWIDGIGGANLTEFKADYITSNNKIKDNPYGVSWFLGTDVGYDFDIDGDFVVSPLFGIAYQNYKVADVSDNDFYVRSGAGLKYSFVTDGIKYDYGIDASIASNGYLFSAVKAGFWSVTDEAGVSLSVGMLKNDIDYNYQLSLDAKMLF